MTVEHWKARAIQAELGDVFARHGLNVAVGLTRQGVAIRSQDDRVDASNLGTVSAHDEQAFVNEQVRQMRRTGHCPCCGAEAGASDSS